MTNPSSTTPSTKRIFITGGASGLGKAIALRYAQQGYQVCIGDVHHERGQEVLTQLQTCGHDACYLPCDVTRLADLEKVKTALLARWAGVDIVVNNAGVGGTAGAIETVPVEDWDWVLNINLNGVMRGIRTFTPLFKQQQSGYFVNIASAAGLFSPAYMSGYDVAKAGVIALSESMHHELSVFNIGTTVVCPAYFTTNLLESMKSTVAGVHANVSHYMARSDITADDIAEAIFTAVTDRQFMLIPHQTVREQWQYKRANPEAFAELMKAEGLKLVKKYQTQPA